MHSRLPTAGTALRADHQTMRAAAIAAIALTCLSATTGQARIGETPKECAARYGRGQGTVQDTATQGVAMYKRAGLVILVTFSKGHAVLVTYLKKGGVFDDTEREQLLVENRRGSAWESLGDEKGGTVFRTKDKKISAYAKNNQLAVMAQGTNPEAQRAGQ